MFEADLFSSPKPKFNSASEQSIVQVLEVMNTYYSYLGAPESQIYQSGAMELNSNNFKVQVGGRAYIVKRWPFDSLAEKNKRKTQAALANWLVQFEARLPLIRESNQKAELVIDHGHWCWCVLDFVEGNYYSGGGNELFEAGVALQELFQMLAQTPIWLQVEQSIQPATLQSLDMMKALELERNHWDEIFSETHASCLKKAWVDIISALEQILNIEAALKSSIDLCHIDLHPHNLLMSNAKTVAFLDFHSFMQAPKGAIIAFNLFKLTRQAIVVRGGKTLDLEVRLQRDKTIFNLLRTGLLEWHVPKDFALLAKAEIMRRLLLILSLNFEARSSEWNHVLPVQIMALQEADIVFS